MFNTTKKPNLWSFIKKNLVQLKISDIERKKCLIKLSFSSSLGVRSIFHNIGNSFFTPKEILDRGDICFFSYDECVLINACHALNQAIEFCNRHSQHKISKVTFGENLCLYIYDINN